MAETKTDEREVVIKHGVFWYHVPELTVTNTGEEKEVLVQRLAFRGERVKLTRPSDIARGDTHGAFMSDDEIKELPISAEIPQPESAGSSGPVNLNELDDEDLVDWLMGTGQFDGQGKPNAEQVVAAVGDDPGLAERVLDAEDTAQGGNPRKSVTEPLEKVATE